MGLSFNVNSCTVRVVVFSLCVIEGRDSSQTAELPAAELTDEKQRTSSKVRSVLHFTIFHFLAVKHWRWLLSNRSRAQLLGLYLVLVDDLASRYNNIFFLSPHCTKQRPRCILHLRFSVMSSAFVIEQIHRRSSNTQFDWCAFSVIDLVILSSFPTTTQWLKTYFFKPHLTSNFVLYTYCNANSIWVVNLHNWTIELFIDYVILVVFDHNRREPKIGSRAPFFLWGDRWILI